MVIAIFAISVIADEILGKNLNGLDLYNRPRSTTKLQTYQLKANKRLPMCVLVIAIFVLSPFAR